MSHIESTQVLVRRGPQKELPENVLFRIFDSLTIDEMFLMSKVCEQWNQTFNNYLRSEFFSRISLGICLLMDQLPQIYRQCLNAEESHVKKRWNCAEESHQSGDGIHVRHLQNCKDPDSSLSIILENCSQLQSLDLRGLTLNLHILRTINKCCPDLECLHLDSVKVDSKAFYYLYQKIIPKLKHLSIDNLFEVKDWDNHRPVWHQLFRRGHNLQDMKLEIFPIESQFECQSLSQLSRELVYLHLNLYSTKDNPNPIKLKDLIKNLTEGLGRSIQFLRLYSEEENSGYKCDPLKSEVRGFSSLRAMNLNLKETDHFEWMYATVSELKELESLTLNLHNLKESQSILNLFLKSELKEKICRLKVENVVISEELCHFLNNNYKQLVSIQLIDVFFENCDSFIEFLTINENLSYLLLQFSKNSHKIKPEYTQLPEVNFFDFISKSNLNELNLINCKQIDRNKCKQICEQKKIEFYYEI